MSCQKRRSYSILRIGESRWSVMVSRSVATGLISSNRSRTSRGSLGSAAANALSLRATRPSRYDE